MWSRFVKSGFTAERDHRHISKISGLLWAKLTPDEKEPWKALYQLEKLRHARLYPNYKFRPMQRKKPRQRRVTRRNGPEEEARNEAFVELTYSGHSVPVLNTFVREFDKLSASAAATRKSSSSRGKRASPLSVCAVHCRPTTFS